MSMSTLYCNSCQHRFSFLRCFIKLEDNKINDEAQVYGPQYAYFPQYETMCDSCLQNKVLEFNFVQNHVSQFKLQIEQLNQQVFEQSLMQLQITPAHLQNPNLFQISETVIQRWEQIKNLYQNFEHHKIELIQDGLSLSANTFINQQLKLVLQDTVESLNIDISKLQEDKVKIMNAQIQFFESNSDLINSGCLIKEAFEKTFSENIQFKDYDFKVKMLKEAKSLLDSFKDPQS